MAEGMHGQYIYVNPRRGEVIVLLSRKHHGLGTQFFREVAIATARRDRR